ncbi:MAG: aryl-sulfate sulfotransferase [Bacilli bacterium]|nr:aryl-sulfate sulfotransferase [Bacilli bacterium]
MKKKNKDIFLLCKKRNLLCIFFTLALIISFFIMHNKRYEEETTSKEKALEKPSDMISWKTTGISKYNGNYHFVTNSKDKKYYYLTKTNNKGELIFYKKLDGMAHLFRLNKNKSNEIRYTYFYCPETDNINYICVDQTGLVVLNENYEEIDTVNSINNIDGHDYIYVDDYDYIFQTNDFSSLEVGGENIEIMCSLIKEIKKGKEQIIFNSCNHKKMYYFLDKSMFDEIGPNYNYLHFNSFVIDPKDNNILVSYKNISSVIKINRKTGNIMWILGGKLDQFGLSKKQLFINQHAIKLEEDGTILIYDNGDEIRNSRILEIKIDEKKKKIMKYESYNLDGVTTGIWGNATLLNKKKKTFLVDYGIGGNADRPDFEEINFKTGKIDFSINFPNQVVTNIYKG